MLRLGTEESLKHLFAESPRAVSGVSQPCRKHPERMDGSIRSDQMEVALILKDLPARAAMSASQLPQSGTAKNSRPRLLLLTEQIVSYGEIV
jgi:hypothetical protein